MPYRHSAFTDTISNDNASPPLRAALAALAAREPEEAAGAALLGFGLCALGGFALGGGAGLLVGWLVFR